MGTKSFFKRCDLLNEMLVHRIYVTENAEKVISLGIE